MKNVFASAPFASALMPGLSALSEGHQRRIKCPDGINPNKYSISVDIDAAMKSRFPQDPRWDYGIVYSPKKPRIAFIEVHGAESTKVSEVIKKKTWLKDLLVEIRLPTAVWYWIPSGKCGIAKHSKYQRSLDQARIRLVNEVILN